MRNAQLILGACIAALGATAVQAQTVYKCTGPAGQVLFQQAPCAAGKGQAVNAEPVNVVQGQPAGDAAVRAQAARGAVVREAIASGQVLPGMTDSELREVMGLPLTINTDLQGDTVRRQHVYKNANGTRYIYTQDGVVTAVQDRPVVLAAQAPRRCWSEAQIQDQLFMAGSATRSDAERRALRQRAEAMQRERCT